MRSGSKRQDLPIGKAHLSVQPMFFTCPGCKHAAAGLDVFEQEPIDPANPLLAMDNVLVMPHSASYSEAAFSLLRTNAGKEEVRIAQGSMPMNLVNKGVTPKANLAPYQA